MTPHPLFPSHVSLAAWETASTIVKMFDWQDDESAEIAFRAILGVLGDGMDRLLWRLRHEEKRLGKVRDV